MKDMDYKVVRGEVCDVESIVQFQADMAMESEGAILDMEKLKKGVSAAMQDESKGIYWVAKTDGKAIGSLMLTREWSDWNYHQLGMHESHYLMFEENL